LNHNVLRNSC